VSRYTQRIRKNLEAAGLSRHICAGHTQCNHHCGLPAGQPAVLLLPDWSPIDGAHLVVVTANEVASYAVRRPYTMHNWCRLQGLQYRSTAELRRLVNAFIRQPASY